MRMATLLLRIPGNWIGDLTQRCDLSVRVLKCVPKNGDGGQSLLQIDGPPDLTGDDITQRIMEIEPGCTVELAAAGPGRHVATVEVDKCLTCRTVTDSGCFLDSANSMQDGRMAWNVIAPNAAALSSLVTRVRRLGCTVEVEKISVLRTAKELTMEQERVLQLAFDLGYYDIPRRIKLEALAKRLEISKPTLDIILRRAQRKVVASHIGGI